jgi:hypothetical protein
LEKALARVEAISAEVIGSNSEKDQIISRLLVDLGKVRDAPEKIAAPTGASSTAHGKKSSSGGDVLETEERNDPVTVLHAQLQNQRRTLQRLCA